MQSAGLDEVEAGIKIAGRNINNLRYVYDTSLPYGRKQKLKGPPEEGERRVKKLA